MGWSVGLVVSWLVILLFSWFVSQFGRSVGLVVDRSVGWLDGS